MWSEAEGALAGAGSLAWLSCASSQLREMIAWERTAAGGLLAFISEQMTDVM